MKENNVRVYTYKYIYIYIYFFPYHWFLDCNEKFKTKWSYVFLINIVIVKTGITHLEVVFLRTFKTLVSGCRVLYEPLELMEK